MRVRTHARARTHTHTRLDWVRWVAAGRPCAPAGIGPQGRDECGRPSRVVFGATGVERFAHTSRRGLGFSGGRACQRLARGSLHAPV